MRPIDANALHTRILEDNEHDLSRTENVAQILLRIEKAPTVDAAPVNRWISCSERLPYIGVDVIVYVRTWREHKVQFGYRYSEKTWSVANIGVPNDEITFWMPLPEPPKRDGE